MSGDRRRLHLVRPEAAIGPALAEGDTVVYIEPAHPGLGGREAGGDRALDADELLERIFRHHLVITW